VDCGLLTLDSSTVDSRLWRGLLQATPPGPHHSCTYSCVWTLTLAVVWLGLAWQVAEGTFSDCSAEDFDAIFDPAPSMKPSAASDHFGGSVLPGRGATPRRHGLALPGRGDAARRGSAAMIEKRSLLTDVDFLVS
jgi:hypothetical protein